MVLRRDRTCTQHSISVATHTNTLSLTQWQNQRIFGQPNELSIEIFGQNKWSGIYFIREHFTFSPERFINFFSFFLFLNLLLVLLPLPPRLRLFLYRLASSTILDRMKTNYGQRIESCRSTWRVVQTSIWENCLAPSVLSTSHRLHVHKAILLNLYLSLNLFMSHRSLLYLSVLVHASIVQLNCAVGTPNKMWRRNETIEWSWKQQTAFRCGKWWRKLCLISFSIACILMVFSDDKFLVRIIECRRFHRAFVGAARGRITYYYFSCTNESEKRCRRTYACITCATPIFFLPKRTKLNVI